MAQEAPLAARMRPRTIDEIVGQEHIIGQGKLLRRAIQSDRLFQSIILFGPPGTGKTTLARVIAEHTSARFETISAVLAGVAELREVIKNAREQRSMHQKRTILFIDEVHRWNKAQQDALLPHVENGLVTLIGATTQNPYFEVIRALVSRSRIFEMHPLSEPELNTLLDRALSDPERGFGRRQVELHQDARNHLVDLAGGDARNLLNALELAVETTPPDPQGKIEITLEIAEESIQQRSLQYDRDGDAHYDTISAFIKSVRGSDPDAAVYWLAKMLAAGEDPRFILRRLIILAGEDIGLADPMGLVVANAAAQAFEFIGMPEGVYPITEATLYLATAPKSNSAGAYFRAVKYITENGLNPVPTHLMDSNRDAYGLGHGAGYEYPHSHPGHFIPQLYLPEAVQGQIFYKPSTQGYEAQIAERVERWRQQQREGLVNKKSKEKPSDRVEKPGKTG